MNTRQRSLTLGIDLVDDECQCDDAFAGHAVGNVFLSECVMMFKEHMGVDVEFPGDGGFDTMLNEVAAATGGHHVAGDINKIRIAKLSAAYVEDGEWLGFCKLKSPIETN